LRRSGTPLEQKRAAKLLPLVSNPHWLLCTLVMCNAACMETVSCCSAEAGLFEGDQCSATLAE
jgi:hypothetical protein